MKRVFREIGLPSSVNGPFICTLVCSGGCEFLFFYYYYYYTT